MLPWLIPGLMNPNCQSFIGSGVVVHVPSLFEELDNLEKKGELFLAFPPLAPSRVHIIDAPPFCCLTM
jgi:adenylosuccinate synthase